MMRTRVLMMMALVAFSSCSSFRKDPKTGKLIYDPPPPKPIPGATHDRFKNDNERIEWLGGVMTPCMGQPVECVQALPDITCHMGDSNGRTTVYGCRVDWPDKRGHGKVKAKYVDMVLVDWKAKL